ncbi:hypothetical protein BH18ACT13_BH18ACT13_02990 [soil metagenome]
MRARRIGQAPWPISIGDVIATEHEIFRVYDVVQTGQLYPVAALVRVVPARLHLAAR